MRSEREMMDLILGVAHADVRVRAVALCGSRANPAARKDRFQDYDVAFAVEDLAPFVANTAFVDVFGERIMMQMPDTMGETPFCLATAERFTWLMLFCDSNRLDLTLLLPDAFARQLAADSLSVLLLDKDGGYGQLPPPTDAGYRVQRPTPKQYADCCNEFWWVAPYVAKGLWRGEYLYAVHHLERCVRAMLLRMLAWRTGFRTGFAAGVGKAYKHLFCYLSEAEGQQLQVACALGSEAGCWQALDACVVLFRAAGAEVAAQLGCDYPQAEDDRVSAYLAFVRQLPREAPEG